ncbi:MAG: isoamylase early set domain-containing protein [Deltaproteobacteria bacterium]|nr:isoamylase early set domain-containing protein [Deltaproteobacteria bacterium]
MSPEEEKEKLRELLGAAFSEEEIETALTLEPDLAAAAGALLEEFSALRSDQVPPLPADFAQKVLGRLEASDAPSPSRKSRSFFPKLALSSALVFGLVAWFWMGYFRAPVMGPPLSVREAVGSDRQKVFFVRFAIRQPAAKQVAVAGDFNQWKPEALSPSSEEEGVFAVELPLSGGAYSYSFVVDGSRWIPDPAADRIVEDGFGQRNSVLNL